MPAYTAPMRASDMRSASSTARLMDCTVFSTFTTTPRFNPSDGLLPTPVIFSWPVVSSISATIAQILVVPMSSPTIRSPLTIVLPFQLVARAADRVRRPMARLA